MGKDKPKPRYESKYTPVKDPRKGSSKGGGKKK